MSTLTARIKEFEIDKIIDNLDESEGKAIQENSSALNKFD